MKKCVFSQPDGMQIGDVAGLGALNYQFTTKVF